MVFVVSEVPLTDTEIDLTDSQSREELVKKVADSPFFSEFFEDLLRRLTDKERAEALEWIDWDNLRLPSQEEEAKNILGSILTGFLWGLKTVGPEKIAGTLEELVETDENRKALSALVAQITSFQVTDGKLCLIMDL